MIIINNYYCNCLTLQILYSISYNEYRIINLIIIKFVSNKKYVGNDVDMLLYQHFIRLWLLILLFSPPFWFHNNFDVMQMLKTQQLSQLNWYQMSATINFIPQNAFYLKKSNYWNVL